MEHRLFWSRFPPTARILPCHRQYQREPVPVTVTERKNKSDRWTYQSRSCYKKEKMVFVKCNIEYLMVIYHISWNKNLMHTKIYVNEISTFIMYQITSNKKDIFTLSTQKGSHVYSETVVSVHFNTNWCYPQYAFILILTPKLLFLLITNYQKGEGFLLQTAITWWSR